MGTSYIGFVIRLMARNRLYTAITIGGLALGLAGCLLILLYVRYETSYDRWLADSSRVHQVQSVIHPPGQPDVHTQASSFVFYDRLAADFPQVEAVTSVAVGKTVAERDGRPTFIEATTVDPTFFQVFPLPFAQGSAAAALGDASSIVLTEREAIRWFGTAKALGRRLTLGAGEGKRDYRVSGVLRDLPRNTNLKVELLFLRDLNAMPDWKREWGNFDQQHFVRLRPGADASSINANLPTWEKRVIPDAVINGERAVMSDAFDFRLVPIGDVHLGETQEGALVPGADPRTLATFGIVAMLTLSLAVINFVNLTTARATQRAREVALRKLLGAGRRQLIAQFMAESALIAAIATLIALALVELAMPWISALLGADLPAVCWGEGGVLEPALALFAVTALAGGLYPAIYLSRFRPAEALRAGRGPAETRGGGRLRALLVVAQFAVAIGLIASTAVIYSQTRFVEQVDPGYRRDGLIQIDNAWRFTQGAEYEAARAAMLAIPGVTATGRTGLGLGSPDKHIRLMRLPGATEYLSMGFYGVDTTLFETMGIELIAGRLLGDGFATDQGAGAIPASGINIVVNRAGAAKLGHRDPGRAVGQQVQTEFDGGKMGVATVVGVVEDARFRTAREAIEPVAYTYDPSMTDQVFVRYAAARPGEVMAALGDVWRRFEPEVPFEARFAEDIVRDLYAAERARTLLFAAFSTLAIVIACLGLFGLASFTAERRTKEIGIRKVLGARVRDIVRLLAWQFSKPVVIANLIAWPVAWWAMRDWLNTFDARIPLGPTPFVLAGLVALVIAIGTVASHAFRIARLNPIHALRYE